MPQRIETALERAVRLALVRFVPELSTHPTHRRERRRIRTLVRTKMKHKLEPTSRQGAMLRRINALGGVSFYESLGFDWRFLGGLFSRGLVQWDLDRHGQRVIRVVDAERRARAA